MRIRASRKEYHKARRKAHPELARAYKLANKKPPTVIGIDGEGITIDGEHRYTYIAAWSVDECIATAENPAGLTPSEVFEFLLAVKRAVPDSLLVGFSLGYDYTKWIEQIPKRELYLLPRPEARKGKKRPRPVRYKGYLLNYLRGRFNLARCLPNECNPWCQNEECPGCKPSGESLAIWDVWGFFQGSFIDACKKWSVIDDAEYAYLKGMKDRRSTFGENDWENVKAYCGVECQKLAKLVTELRQAHNDANIPLASYYGAGSTASSLLARMGIKQYMPKDPLPDDLMHAIACSFFGGRFEISRIGPVREQCESYDIASAYPYHLTGLPCLACGKWRKVRHIPHDARWGFVRYVLPPHRDVKVKGGISEMAWGPLPFRMVSGDIVYPATSGGGWVCLEEFRMAELHWPNVYPLEAWIYDTPCDHRPFTDLANIYILRLEWGKESRGIVVKLGPNSCYGKIAQSLGDKPPFQCFPWASMITGGTRSQLLQGIAYAPPSILMTATDGIVGTQLLELDSPRETGTAEAAKRFGKSPLGAWEHKSIPDGMHLIRPGIAFPLSGELEAEVKGRGIGKAVLKNHRAQVLASWEEHGPKPFKVRGSIFHGFKSATSLTREGYQKANNYGQWSERETEVSYMPEPKRPFAFTEDKRLCTWALDREMTSQPYARILGQRGETPASVIAMMIEKQLQSEQPDREDSIDEL